jgi:type I restriction enzyme, S subunit
MELTKTNAVLRLSKGFKQTEIGMIPKDWEIKSIEELTPQNKKNGIVDGPFGSNLKTIHYRKSGIPIITSGYVTNGYFLANEYLYVDIDKFKQEKRSAVKGGDIVMAKIGERCGACAILPKNHPEGILSGNALKITIDESKYLSSLVWQILYNNYVTGKLEILRTTGAQPALSMANLKKFPIPLPPTLAEQTAIATALSDADAWINSLEKLIAKKRLVKQGAMQELLKPKEGWEVKSLGELITYKNGKSFESQIIDNGAYLLITLNSIDIRGKLKKGHLKVAVSDNSLQKGDLIIVLSDVAHGNFLGLTDIIPENNKYVLNQRMGALKNLNGIIPEFLRFQINNNQSYFKMSGKGSSQQNLGKDDILNFEINLPNIPEQTRIASILSDMDAELEKLEEKLTKAKQVKQGMMQELLTGRVRLV